MTSTYGPDPAEGGGSFGRHRLRATDAVVIDLPIETVGSEHVWVATIWPDERAVGGWARFVWERAIGERGWLLPRLLAAGDVLEFGADKPSHPVRWYGIMDSYEPDRWLTTQGPYATPTEAWDDAQLLLGLHRFQPAVAVTMPDDFLACRAGRRPNPACRRRRT